MKSYRPGPTMLIGISSYDPAYKRLWARLQKRRDARGFARRAAARCARYRANHRAKRNAEARAWRAENPRRVAALNREYRVLKGYACHFCGRAGRRAHPLRSIIRAVEEHGVLRDARVFICWQCRGAGPCAGLVKKAA